MSSTNKSSPARNESGGDGDGDIAVDLFPFLRVYKDGRIKKFVRHATVPASPVERSPSGVVTKDAVAVDDETGVSSGGEDHCFHLSPRPNPNAAALMDHVAEFIAKGNTSTSSPMAKRRRRRRRCTLHGAGAEKTTSMHALRGQTAPKVQHAGSGIMANKADNHRARASYSCSMRTSSKSSPSPARGNIAVDLRPFLVEFNDGRRWVLVRHETVAASSDENARSASGVATKDVVIDDETGVSVRVFLPVDAAVAAAAGDGRRLPLVVYVHGGAFCTGSASARMFHDYAESLSARAAAVVVSVDYRLAPAHPVPAAYDDAWAALRWAASRRRRRLSDDAWVGDYADRSAVGANIVHNVALRAGAAIRNTGEVFDDDIDIEGMILLQPYFWGTERLPCETPGAASWRTRDPPPMLLPERIDALWPYVTAGAAANNGDPRIDPPAEAIASLPGVDHCFHLLPEFSSHAETGVLMDRVAMFIAKGKTPPPISMLMEEERVTKKTRSSAVVPACWRVPRGPRCTAQTVVGLRRAGFGVGNMIRLPSKARKCHRVHAAALRRSVFQSTQRI
uniref:Alpha/beta hydrolase fold-3 domain-containing protein n=1 Tax=Oryza barthii TaxID=65489 RepID=A0A0D3H785_9ORYZ